MMITKGNVKIQVLLLKYNFPLLLELTEIAKLSIASHWESSLRSCLESSVPFALSPSVRVYHPVFDPPFTVIQPLPEHIRHTSPQDLWSKWFLHRISPGRPHGFLTHFVLISVNVTLSWESCPGHLYLLNKNPPVPS